MTRKDGVRGNSKKKDKYANSNWRATHQSEGKGGKKTSKRMRVAREVREA